MAEYHPFAVHFPIVVMLLWPVVDLLGLWTKRDDVCRVALGLLALALVSSLAATLTGQAAYDAAIASGVDTQLIRQHSDNAEYVPWVLVLVLLLRIVGVAKWGRKAHWLAMGLGLTAAGFIIVVSSDGGDLVHEHGVGRRAPNTSKNP